MTKKTIGFTQEDKIEVAPKSKKKRFQFQSILGITVTGLLLFGVGSCVADFSDYRSEKKVEDAERKEKVAQQREQKAKEKAEKKDESDKAWADKTQKKMAVEYVAEKSASDPQSIIDKFNKELDSVEENKIFKSKFKLGTKGLLLEVDVNSAVSHFGQSEDVVRLGISQGSDNYKGYLDRYKNLSGLNTSVLHIVDKHGKLISEVK